MRWWFSSFSLFLLLPLLKIALITSLKIFLINLDSTICFAIIMVLEVLCMVMLLSAWIAAHQWLRLQEGLVFLLDTLVFWNQNVLCWDVCNYLI